MKIVCEHIAKAAYEMGHEDGKAGRPAKPEQFIVTKGNELVLKKKYSDFLAQKH